MGAETYIAIAEQYGFNEEQTAYLLVHFAEACMRTVKSNVRMSYDQVGRLCSDSLECRIVSAFIFEDIGKNFEKARSLNQAGRSAQACNAFKLSAELNEISARMFEVEGETVDAGYALLNAAGALLRKRNRLEYFEKIGYLIEKGQSLFEASGQPFNRGYLDGILAAYARLRDERGNAPGAVPNI